jgi:hypothetical protein
MGNSSTHHPTDCTVCLPSFFKEKIQLKKEIKKKNQEDKQWAMIRDQIIVLQSRQDEIQEKCDEYMNEMKRLDPIKDIQEIKGLHVTYSALKKQRNSTVQTIATVHKQMADYEAVSVAKDSVKLLTNIQENITGLLKTMDMPATDTLITTMQDNNASVNETHSLMAEIHDASNDILDSDVQENDFDDFIHSLNEKKAMEIDNKFLIAETPMRIPTKMGVPPIKKTMKKETQVADIVW